MLKKATMPTTRGELQRISASAPPVNQGGNTPTPAQYAAAAEWFKPIFIEICANCPGWKAAIPDGGADSVAQVWFEALVSKKSALNPEAIRRGMRGLQSKRLTWLPHPLDFVDMCTGDQGGSVPPLEEVKYEILQGRKTEYMDGKWVKIPFSSPFVEYLAEKTGSILHPTTLKELRDTGFAIEYRAAVEKFKSGYFDKPKNKQIAQQPMDSNLEYYFMLLKSYGEELASDFLTDCARRGIHIDPVQQTVTRGASVVVERVASNRKPVAKVVELTDEERKIAGMVKGDPFRVSGIYLSAVIGILEKIGERHELTQVLKAYVMANGGEAFMPPQFN